MFLQCSICGEKLRLGKYYPSTGWYSGGVIENMPLKSQFGVPFTSEQKDDFAALTFYDDFQKFLDTHSPCVQRNSERDFDWEGVHRLHENPTDEQIVFGKVFVLVYEEG